MKKTILFIFLFSDLIVIGQNYKTHCNFINPDTSIHNIILKDSISKIKQLGNNFNLTPDSICGLPCIRYCTKDKRQTLTLFLHYGAFKNEFAEFEVKSYSDDDNAFVLQTNNFISGKEISLGKDKKEIVTILGKCYKSSTLGKDSELITYSIDDFNNSKFLQRFNYPNYFAEYEFKNEKLIRFKFGFSYP